MKVIKGSFTSLFATLVVWLGSLNLLYAQQAVKPIPGEGADLETWIVTILKYLIGIAGIVAAAVLIINGFMFITASGDENKIKKATQGITYAIIGLVIAAIAFLIVNYVAQLIQNTKG
jgi:hypothetical protein